MPAFSAKMHDFLHAQIYLPSLPPSPFPKVLVFVHARNATVRTATALRDLAADSNELQHFQPDQTPEFGWATKQVVEAVHLVLHVVCVVQRAGATVTLGDRKSVCWCCS